MKKELYPIEYNGRMWSMEECDDLFSLFYTNPYCLNYDKSVYVGENLYIYPDGEMCVQL